MVLGNMASDGQSIGSAQFEADQRGKGDRELSRSLDECGFRAINENIFRCLDEGVAWYFAWPRVTENALVSAAGSFIWNKKMNGSRKKRKLSFEEGIDLS